MQRTGSDWMWWCLWSCFLKSQWEDPGLKGGGQLFQSMGPVLRNSYQSVCSPKWLLKWFCSVFTLHSLFSFRVVWHPQGLLPLPVGAPPLPAGVRQRLLRPPAQRRPRSGRRSSRSRAASQDRSHVPQEDWRGDHSEPGEVLRPAAQTLHRHAGLNTPGAERVRAATRPNQQGELRLVFTCCSEGFGLLLVLLKPRLQGLNQGTGQTDRSCHLMLNFHCVTHS